MQCQNCDSEVNRVSKGLVRGKADRPGPQDCPECGEPLEQKSHTRLEKGI